MPTVFCSHNLAALIGKDRLTPIPETNELDPRANWHARLFYLSRRKCILWTNKATLYSFVRVNILKKDLIDLPQVFLSSLFAQLKHDRFYDDKQENYWLDNLSKLSFTKTNNDKSVIGSMNDFIHHIDVGIKYGSTLLEEINDITLAHYLNTIPMGKIHLKTPKGEFRKLINGITAIKFSSQQDSLKNT
jgi:hypothetical protein